MSTGNDTATAVSAAMSVAKDLAEGRLTADQFQSYAVTSCHELLSTVVGPSDALWDVQLGICRGVLAARGLSSTS